jgi:hypothetical protein
MRERHRAQVKSSHRSGLAPGAPVGLRITNPDGDLLGLVRVLPGGGS